jgi:membrane fusion protein (multidrug efflux system)
MATNKEAGEYEQDFTPKTAKRKINKPVVIILAVVILLAGLGIAGYFIYQGDTYYQTDNAKVDTNIYQLTANASGKLLNVYVVQNEGVIAGQVLARVANGADIKSLSTAR